MMTLPPELKREFKQELDQFEEEHMPIISSVEEIAKEEGIEQGIQQGIQQGIEQGIQQEKQEVARNLLRLGITLEIITQATGLTVEQVEFLAQE
jgi:predicted transposase/invertase (TIGR01784 family)